MNNQQQPPTNNSQFQNKFVGKKIENTLSFNADQIFQDGLNNPNQSQICSVQIHQNKVQKTYPNINKIQAQAIPLTFAIPQKKSVSKIVNNQPIQNSINSIQQKTKPKSHSQTQGNSLNKQHSSQIQNLIQEQSKQINEEQYIEESSKNQGPPLSLQERRQQKKLEQIQNEQAPIKKEIPIIQQANNDQTIQGECNEFIDTIISKKNRFSNLLVQQQIQVQQPQQINQIMNMKQNIQEKEQKKQADIDEMVRKSNLKYKTDKEMQEIQKYQKQQEMLKLKEKLKKQEEDIRKRNQQKTQNFKEKQKCKEKEQQLLQQEQQQKLQEQQSRRKSMSKQNRLHQQSKQNESQQNNSDDNTTNEKPEITKEQFDLSTRNRVKDLMKKQKEEKEKLEEEKEKKRQKLEILRQEQLIQLQKAKIKTVEQEEEERKAQILKRQGGSSIAQSSIRDTRQLTHQRIQQENTQNQQGNSEYYDEQNDYEYSKEENDRTRQKSKNQRDKSTKSKKLIEATKNISSIIPRSQSNNKGGNKNNKSITKDEIISENFFKENIQASIKQLYPNCSKEEQILLEEEYRREFMKDMNKPKKNNQVSQQKMNLPKPTSSKKNDQNEFEKLKRKQQTENKEELKKLLELKKFDNFDVDSVKNPIEMIENLKQLATELQDDIDLSDRKFGIGKYKRNQNNIQISSNNNQPKQTNKMKEEIAKLEREAYLKELYLNAQNSFSPEEMEDFEEYLQNHLVDGEIIFSDEENDTQEQESQQSEDELSVDEEQKKQYSQNTHKYSIVGKQKQKIDQDTIQKNQISHSKSVQDLSDQNEVRDRGRSQDQKTPRSCLVKEQKQKRSKTVTFDQKFIESQQKSNDPDEEKCQQNKENSSIFTNQKLNDQKQNQNNNFDKKSQDLKDLILQYSGEKRSSIDISNPMSSLESSSSSNLRLSHLKPQNSTIQIEKKELNIKQTEILDRKQNHKIQEKDNSQINRKQISNQQEKSKINNQHSKNEQYKSIVNQQKGEHQTQNNIFKDNSKNTISDQENINSMNTLKTNPQFNNLKKNIEKQIKESQTNPKVNIEQTPKIQNEFENDFINFNEQFDIDKFKNEISQDDLKQLLHVNKLDFKSFFTNDKMNTLEGMNSKQFEYKQKYNQNYIFDDDEDDEGLFDEDYPNQNQNKQFNDKSQNENAQNLELNSGLIPTNQKNKQQYNNYLQSTANNLKQNDSQNENLQNEDNNNDFFDDDNLFALSAAELLKLAKNTNI